MVVDTQWWQDYTCCGSLVGSSGTGFCNGLVIPWVDTGIFSEMAVLSTSNLQLNFSLNSMFRGNYNSSQALGQM